MRAVTAKEMAEMSHNDLLKMFNSVMEEMAELLHRSRLTLNRQHEYIAHLEQKVRELEADA